MHVPLDAEAPSSGEATCISVGSAPRGRERGRRRAEARAYVVFCLRSESDGCVIRTYLFPGLYEPGARLAIARPTTQSKPGRPHERRGHNEALLVRQRLYPGAAFTTLVSGA